MSRKRTVPILLSVAREPLPVVRECVREKARGAEWVVAGTTVELAVGTLEHWWLPPHSVGGFTSVTHAASIGVSFSGHRRAVHQTLSGPVKQTKITPGAAFVTMSGELQWLEVLEPSEALEIHLARSLLQEVANDLGTSRPIALDDVVAADDPIVLGVSNTLRAQLLHGGAIDELHTEALVRGLVEHTVREYGGVRAPRMRPGRIDMRRLRRVAVLVRERLHERLSLADLAREAALTPFHFARSFRLTTGITPHNFVRAARMQRAAELARNTLLSTAALAERVGYTNIAHFREVFVRMFGCTPAELRANTASAVLRE